jgi:hypothetical protein
LDGGVAGAGELEVLFERWVLGEWVGVLLVTFAGGEEESSAQNEGLSGEMHRETSSWRTTY